ncbi:MAG: twin-arginine translocase TatA/TatE family subunit [Desulfurococcales archaeon]|nr:twin-arginine translocase TatA/TatE family subunit [Desulfurococcales archaeon]
MVLPSSVGPLELAIIFVILLIIFGPRRLVDLASSLGEAIRAFREGVEGKTEERREKEKEEK